MCRLFSKQTFKKMISEVSFPVTVGMLQDYSKSIDSKEEVDEFVLSQLDYIDGIVAEIRRRAPQPQGGRRKKDTEGSE